MKWKKISDQRVRHRWILSDECLENGCEEKNVDKEWYVDPSYYAGSGTPVCPNCGDDLVYDRTEILVPERRK